MLTSYKALLSQFSSLRALACIRQSQSYFAIDSSVITDLIRALWRVNLMLALSRSLLNREYNLMNVLKAERERE
jgi:hypothetical protein